MTHPHRTRAGLSSLLLAGMMTLLLSGTGCEMDSFFDPSQLVHPQPTPVVLPILQKLDLIDEPDANPIGLSEVQPEDLIPEVREYVIGTGDVIIITVAELRLVGQDETQVRQVDELGTVRLYTPDKVMSFKAAGRSASQLEEDLAELIQREQILRSPTVSIVVNTKRQNTFSIIGEPREGSSAFGTYPIPEPEFRLLDAVAMARGITGRARNLLIYRVVPLTPEVAGDVPSEEVPNDGVDQNEVPEDAGKDPSDLIDLEKALEGEDVAPAPRRGDDGTPAPPALERGLDGGTSPPKWVWVDGNWVRVQQPAVPKTGVDTLDASQLITQRIIRVPFDKLLDGDMRYNIVIRPGDIIKVPALNTGNVYISGEVGRPGTYVLPGERDLTIKTLMAAAGGTSPTAIPERSMIIRRLEGDREAFVRIDIKKIHQGTAPDVYLKPNDHILVGTNFWAVPLAVVRNGFRTTYGFGFILDRNFNLDVFRPDN